jgi:transposase
MNSMVIGWDLHRKFSAASVVARLETGDIRVMRRARLDHGDREAIRRWLAQFPSGTPVTMEGAFGWPWVADLLTEMGFDPHLGHPPAIRVLAKNEAKTDRKDADRLGRLWLEGKFPQAYLATPEVRQLRERLRYRMALVGLRSGLKNRIQAILHRLGLLHKFTDLFGKSGREWLEALELPTASREVLDGQLRLLDILSELITEVEDWMRDNLLEDAVVRGLMTIPGIGKILAHVIRAETGELERFANVKKYSAYCGLAPMSDQSADKDRPRHISPYCNHTLRWAFIEAAGCLLNSKSCPERLRKLHARLTHGGRANKSQAKVALAHQLCELVYVIWKKGDTYREHPPTRPGTPRRGPGTDVSARSSL